MFPRSGHASGSRASGRENQRKWVPHILTNFFGSTLPPPPSRGVSSYFIHKWEGHCVRSSLRRPWNLCLRLAAWSKPRMFGEESLGKIKFRAFRKCVDHGFYRLKAFITLEQVNTTECGRIKTRMLISKTAMVSLRSWRYCVVVEWDLAVEPL